MNALAPHLNFEQDGLSSRVTKGGKKLLARWRNAPGDHRISAGANRRQQELIECLLKMSPRCPPSAREPDMPDWGKVPRLPSRQPEREGPSRKGHRKSLKRKMDGKTGVIQLKLQSLLYKNHFRQSRLIVTFKKAGLLRFQLLHAAHPSRQPPTESVFNWC